jgi:hypothetical protein
MSVKIATARRAFVKTSVRREIAKNAMGRGTANQNATQLNVKAAWTGSARSAAGTQTNIVAMGNVVLLVNGVAMRINNVMNIV